MRLRALTALAAAVLLLLLPLAPAPAAAQADLRRLNGRLEEIAAVSALQGYQLDGQALSSFAVNGVLEAGDSVVLVLDLFASRSYRITGACDRGCGDLNLRARDPARTEVPLAEDTLADSLPLLEFQPRTTGPHLLTVQMRECTSAGCFFGVRILSK